MLKTEQTEPERTLKTPQQAVSLLIQGIQVAQQRGAYQLNEASILSDAVNFLTGGPTIPTVLGNNDENVDSAAEADDVPEEVEETVED